MAKVTFLWRNGKTQFLHFRFHKLCSSHKTYFVSQATGTDIKRASRQRETLVKLISCCLKALFFFCSPLMIRSAHRRDEVRAQRGGAGGGRWATRACRGSDSRAHMTPTAPPTLASASCTWSTGGGEKKSDERSKNFEKKKYKQFAKKKKNAPCLALVWLRARRIWS